MSKKISKLDIDLKQNDLQMRGNYVKMEEAEKMLVRLDNLQEILESDPQREAYIKLTKKRIGHLLIKMLERPLTNEVADLVWHAEIRGRLMEQIQHVNTMSQVGAGKNFFERVKAKLMRANEGLSQRNERQGE